VACMFVPFSESHRMIYVVSALVKQSFCAHTLTHTLAHTRTHMRHTYTRHTREPLANFCQTTMATRDEARTETEKG